MMKNIKVRNVILIIVLSLLVIGTAVGGVLLINSKEYTNVKNGTVEEYDDLDPSYDKETATYVKLNGDSIECDSEGVSFAKSTVTIKQEGVYVFSGELNGKIVVDLDKDTKVRIILNNVSITSNDGPAIYGNASDKIIITLDENSTNTLVDSSKYSNEEEWKGTISSNDDITINGSGKLNITGNFKNGIQSNDKIKIVNGDINITAANNGIVANDEIKIKDGNVTIKSGNSGIKAKNEEDSTKGYIIIENGNISIESEKDGIEAVNYIEIEDGNINIKSGGGATNTTKTSQENFRQMINQRNTNSTTTTTESYKGIKADSYITIKNGNIKIDSADDAIHSNGDITIDNGSFEISSGDDGMHADANLTINNGDINIKTSYEGIEGKTVTINSGDVKVKAQDDGINVAGGSNEAKGGFQDEFAANGDNKFTINGGNIYVNADGDGLDSNGSIYMNGGTVVVDGPTNSGNGALDYNGEFIQKGGSLVAAGASGMAQAISNNSSIYALSATLTSNQSANTKVTVTNSAGEEIASYTSSKSFNNIIISTDKLKKGETYKLNINGNTYQEFTVSNVVTYIGNSQNGMGNMSGNPGNMNQGNMPGNMGQQGGMQRGR